MSWWKQTVLALALIAIAGAVWLYTVPAASPLLVRLGLGDGESVAATAPPRFGGADGPIRVIGAPVETGEANGRVSAIGDGRAVRTVTVTPLAPGRIEAVEVSDGQQVEVGAVLVRLDSEAEAIALARADLAVENAAATLDRVERLQDTGAATDVQLIQARLALETAGLELRDAELDLANRSVTAPIAGTVGILAVEPGARVAIDTEIATIVDRSRILVDFRVPERLAGRLTRGEAVSVTPLAHPEMALEGEISALDNRVDPESRTLRVQAAIDNGDDRLRGGMAFLIELVFGGDSYPSVAPLAIQWGASGAFVWVEREGRAVQVPVRIVQRTSEAVLVAGEIAAGERVVTEGIQRLREGAEIAFDDDPAPGEASGLSRADPTVSET